MTDLTQIEDADPIDEEEFDDRSEALIYIDQILNEDPFKIFPLTAGCFSTEVQFEELLGFLMNQCYIYAPDAKDEDDVIFDNEIYISLLERVMASMYSYFNFATQILGLSKLYASSLTNPDLIPIDLETKKYDVKMDDLFKSPDIPLYLFIKAIFKLNFAKQIYPNQYNIDNIMNFYSFLPAPMRNYLNEDMEKIIKQVYPTES